MQTNRKLAFGSMLGAITIQVVFIACNSMSGSTDGGIGDAMGIHDAKAQDSGTPPMCPSCVTRIVTADTDHTRMLRGTVGLTGGMTMGMVNAGVPVLDGPFVLSDINVNGDGSQTAMWTVPVGTPCGDVPGGTAPNEVLNPISSMHGARYLISSGQTLCALAYYSWFDWAGFRPYDVM